jgi:hypothetical protein
MQLALVAPQLVIDREEIVVGIAIDGWVGAWDVVKGDRVVKRLIDTGRIPVPLVEFALPEVVGVVVGEA